MNGIPAVSSESGVCVCACVWWIYSGVPEPAGEEQESASLRSMQQNTYYIRFISLTELGEKLRSSIVFLIHCIYIYTKIFSPLTRKVVMVKQQNLLGFLDVVERMFPVKGKRFPLK